MAVGIGGAIALRATDAASKHLWHDPLFVALVAVGAAGAVLLLWGWVDGALQRRSRERASHALALLLNESQRLFSERLPTTVAVDDWTKRLTDWRDRTYSLLADRLGAPYALRFDDFGGGAGVGYGHAANEPHNIALNNLHELRQNLKAILGELEKQP